jgi:hypothetical protein
VDREVDGVFAQIGDNPYRTAQAWAPGPGTAPDAVGARAIRALEFLDAMGVSEEERGRLAGRCANVPTTLKPLGDAVCADLLEHGYVLTLVSTFVVLGLGDLDRAVARNRFPRRNLGAVPR